MLKHSNEEVNIQSETKNSKIIGQTLQTPNQSEQMTVPPELSSAKKLHFFFSSHSCQILAHKELSDWRRGKYSRENGYS